MFLFKSLLKGKAMPEDLTKLGAILSKRHTAKLNGEKYIPENAEGASTDAGETYSGGGGTVDPKIAQAARLICRHVNEGSSPKAPTKKKSKPAGGIFSKIKERMAR